MTLQCCPVGLNKHLVFISLAKRGFMSHLCSCLQAMSSSLAVGSEVRLSCSAETSRAHCLQVLGGTSVKRVNGSEMKGLVGKFWYQQHIPYGCLGKD